ncbi:MAG: hypothetical protein HOY71_33235, partial [Nonomuraea sp.]|nr:hypothetical protein [Nonomuraea sp.]
MGRYVRLLPTVVRAGLLCWAIAAFAGDAVRTPWTLVLVAGTAVLGALVRDRPAWLLALLLLATAEAATLPLLAG